MFADSVVPDLIAWEQSDQGQHFDDFFPTKQVYIVLSTSGLEKLKKANRSISAVNDRLFPVELTEIADCPNICFIRISDKP